MKKTIISLFMIIIISLLMIMFNTTNVQATSSDSEFFELQFEIINNEENENIDIYLLLPKEYIEFAIEHDNLDIEYEPTIKGKCYVATIEINDKLKDYFNHIFSKEEEILKAIVKGAFLGAGSINNPEKKYHLEILFKIKENVNYIINICKNFGINLKQLESKSKYILYLKEAEEISKFLALIGANKAVLKFEEIRIMREMKNNVNRLVNCETANINKTVNAAVDQINDIKLIQSKNKFEELPEELRDVALARLENPECTLKELGEKLIVPIGKSGVNHRLKKIHEFAEELRK